MQVIITPKALKQFYNLPSSEKIKIKKKFHLIESFPQAGKKLTGQLVGIWSLRAWPYRILYWIDDKSKKVYIVTIAHRQGVYK